MNEQLIADIKQQITYENGVIAIHGTVPSADDRAACDHAQTIIDLLTRCRASLHLRDLQDASLVPEVEVPADLQEVFCVASNETLSFLHADLVHVAAARAEALDCEPYESKIPRELYMREIVEMQKFLRAHRENN